MSDNETVDGTEPDDLLQASAETSVEQSQPAEPARIEEVPPDFTKGLASDAVKLPDQSVGAVKAPMLPLPQRPPVSDLDSSLVKAAASTSKARGFFAEMQAPVMEVAPRLLRHRTRRDVLLFGAGAMAALAGAGFLLPQQTLDRVGLQRNLNSRQKEWLLNRALRIDDDVAEALYSNRRMVPTYSKSQVTPLKNNYNGATPDPKYISGWNLTLKGLSSGLTVALDIRNFLTRFPVHEEVTRLVCVEGWSAIAWWAGLRFDDLLRAYPPMSQAKWAKVESSVNLDASGNSDPYYISLDLETARHPQTLLATHFSGQPLTVEHGAPLRLIVPVKLGLKNVKAITNITYIAEEPSDYWSERGYSRYDGL
jgi:DMSO/TMAO reductase YedYZ molybdopterin-dependent catalytic subunit